MQKTLIGEQWLPPFCHYEPFWPYRNSWRLVFVFGNGRATVCLRIIVRGDLSGADLVIAEMATQPGRERGKGYGRSALEYLMRWAKKCGFETVRAVQVQEGSEGFWKSRGFTPLKNRSNDFETKVA